MCGILFAAVVACNVLLPAHALSPHPNHYTQAQDTQQPSAQNAETDHGVGAGPTATSNGERGSGGKDKEHECGYRGPQWFSGFYCFFAGHEKFWISFGTVILAAFTTILGAATILLWRATRKLVAGAELTSEQQLRAYVHNRKVEWKAGRRVGAPWGDDLGWVFSIEWHNSGPTRARHFLSHINWEPFLSFEGDLPDRFHFGDTGEPQAGPSYVAPKDSTKSAALFIEASTLDAVRVGHLRLFLWGWATYFDIFSATLQRETQFCFELDRIDGNPYDIPLDAVTPPAIFFNFRVCGSYNCADEDCNQEA
jgi:hypothetical protein